MLDSNWASWFRHASPYIKKHQNTTMVLALSGELLESSQLESLTHDLALLNSLGVKLVLVLGARPQIDAALASQFIQSSFHRGMRVTTQEAMPHVIAAFGSLKTELEAKLSMGVVNSPMHGGGVKVVSGNFVVAKPFGVLDGIDFGCTGTFRRLDTEAIEACLDNRSIVIIPALGFSMTGEVFNLESGELAAQVAAQLQAQKLILFGCQLHHQDQSEIRQLSVEQAEELSALNAQGKPFLSTEQSVNLTVSMRSCSLGVGRTHIVSYLQDDALLRELFTRDGSGTLVTRERYDEIRRADIDDVNGILELIRPLEEQGVLIRRSRERLESELDLFWVNVRDNAVLACIALYPFEGTESAELSCFAVDEAYQKGGRGERLLELVVSHAKAQGLKKIFVLTTQTEHWFKERGFILSCWEDLPETKRYNHDRRSKVLVNHLGNE